MTSEFQLSLNMSLRLTVQDSVIPFLFILALIDFFFQCFGIHCEVDGDQAGTKHTSERHFFNFWGQD